MGSIPATGSCEWCKAPLYSGKRFCSVRCSAKQQFAFKAVPIGYCLVCRKSYDARAANGGTARKYCSHSCAATASNKTRVKDKICCRRCGASVHTGRVFCSRTCNQLYKREQVFSEILRSGVVSGSPTAQKRFLVAQQDSSVPCCDICGITEWRGQPILLVLDHANGDATDNAITNLRVVCSNCDAQLPTYKGKNKGNGMRGKRTRQSS